MGAGSQILAQITENQFTVTEIPIDVRYDIRKPSSQNPISHGWTVLTSIVWYVAEKRPLQLLGVPGLVSCAIGIFCGLWLLQEYNQSHYFSLPLSILVAMFTIIGVIAVFMSLTLYVITRLQYRQPSTVVTVKK